MWKSIEQRDKLLEFTQQIYETGYKDGLGDVDIYKKSFYHEGYAKGEYDIFDCIKKINEWEDSKREEVFCTIYLSEILSEHNPTEIIKIVKDYEEQQTSELKIGDEVICVYDGKKGIVDKEPCVIDDKAYISVYFGGYIRTISIDKITRTGKHNPHYAEMLGELSKNDNDKEAQENET